MRKALHAAVLRTRGVPPLRALYRGVYRAAAGLGARGLLALPAAEGVYLHRGLTREGWEPGVSDVDLLLLRGELAARESEARWLSRLEGRLGALRAALPMLGDLWVGTRAEVGAYLRWGGLRAWEDAPDWRLLAGRGLERPRLAERALKRRWLDAWVWLLLAHMEISRRRFSPRGDERKAEADVRKMLLDARRYAAFLLDARAPAPRARAAEAERAGGARLSTRDAWLETALLLARASREVWRRVGSAGAATAGVPEAAGPRRPALERLARIGGAAVLDEPYHAYALLPEGSGEAAYERAAAALERERLPGVPLCLGPDAWALLLQSSYLGAPLGWLGAGGGGQAPRGGDPFAGWSAVRAGALPESPLLPAALRWETAAEAASWMALWWRSLWTAPGWSNRFTVFHLLTRSAGLRLALAGLEPGPLSDWQLLLARLSAEEPDSRRSLGRARALLRAETDAALDSCDRRAVSAGHVAVIARSMEALNGALGSGSAAVR